MKPKKFKREDEQDVLERNVQGYDYDSELKAGYTDGFYLEEVPNLSSDEEE